MFTRTSPLQIATVLTATTRTIIQNVAGNVGARATTARFAALLGGGVLPVLINVILSPAVIPRPGGKGSKSIYRG